MGQTSEDTTRTKAPTIPPLDPERVSLIEAAGLTLKQLESMGVEIYGADVRADLPEPVIQALEQEMANRGFIVFKHQKDLSPEELINASKWWGAREIHSTHGVHPATADQLRLLTPDEMRELFNDYDDLLNESFEKDYGIRYHYDTGDLLFIDNWAVAHRASSVQQGWCLTNGRRGIPLEG